MGKHELGWTEAIGSVADPGGRFALVGVVKRTYELRAGKLSLCDEQQPIVEEPEVTENDDGSIRDLIDDADVLASKVATDVVVRGVIRAEAAKRELDVGVAVGPSRRRLRVAPPRRVRVAPGGAVRFEQDGPIRDVEIRYENAYGGYDEHAHRELDPDYTPCETPVGEGAPPRMVGVYAYPRNALGGSYFIDIDRRRADGIELPLLEDPDDPLRPECFFVRAPLEWIDAPLPGGFGWLPHPWFPRFVRFMGPILPHAAPRRGLREATFADGEDLRHPQQVAPGRVHPRALQGAAPGLACARLRGDEVVELDNLVAKTPSLRFALPGEVPVVTICPPDVKRFQPTPVLQTVRIDVDRMTVSLTWCASLRLAVAGPVELLDETSLVVSWRPS